MQNQTQQGNSPRPQQNTSRPPAPPYQGGYQGNRPWQRREERPYEKGKHRLNHNIRVPEVRVVQDGKQLGIMKTGDAVALATEAGMDLVEIAPNGTPPVCSIMKYDEFKYREKIKEKDAARKQRESSAQWKEIRLSPSIGQHDLEVKVKQAKGFLEDDKRLQVVVFFQRRQLNHKDLGFEVIKQFIAALGENVVVESAPRLEGNKLNARIAKK
jgi:translation initiation factor IF-3